MDQLVIGALVAVVGGGIGALITARIEHRRWLRQERLEAWDRVLGLAIDLHLNAAAIRALDKAAEAAAESKDLDQMSHHRAEAREHDATLKTLLLSTSSIQARVFLLGPRDNAETARELLGAGSALAQLRDVDDEENAKMEQRARVAIDEFIRAARKVLDSE